MVHLNENETKAITNGFELFEYNLPNPYYHASALWHLYEAGKAMKKSENELMALIPPLKS